MRPARLLAVALTTMLTTLLSLTAPAAGADGLTYTVSNAATHQEYLYCSNEIGPCTLEGASILYVGVTLNTADTPAQVDYKIVDGTAKLGVDFGGQRTGTVYISSSPTSPESGTIDIPLIITGATQAKQFTVKLTSASPAGDISSVGTETILPGNEIPDDCTLYRNAGQSKSLTCTARPAGEPWYVAQLCYWYIAGAMVTNGTTVVGDGTSTVICTGLFGTQDSTAWWVQAGGIP